MAPLYEGPPLLMGMKDVVERAISDAEFEFANAKVRVQAECDFQALELPGLKIGPFSKGERYSLPLWVALELARRGVVRLVEPAELSVDELIRAHSRETRLSRGLAADLPSDFYPRLRRLLAKLREEASRDPSRLRELDRVQHMARDIVNVRLKKVISLASSVARSPLTRKHLTPEEELLFDTIGDLADAWREEVVGNAGGHGPGSRSRAR